MFSRPLLSTEMLIRKKTSLLGFYRFCFPFAPLSRSLSHDQVDVMKFLIAISLPLLAVASPVDESALLTERQSPILNATVEYRAQCKTCPWNLCTNVVIADQDQVVNLTCWTE